MCSTCENVVLYSGENWRCSDVELLLAATQIADARDAECTLTQSHITEKLSEAGIST